MRPSSARTASCISRSTRRDHWRRAASRRRICVSCGFDPATAKTETVGVPDLVGFDEAKVKHVYTRSAKFRVFYMQGAAIGADGSLYLMGIYPQLHVACFPKLTAPR